MERRRALKEKEKAGVFREDYEKWSWIGNLKGKERKWRGMGSLIRVWRQKKKRRTFGRKKSERRETWEKKKKKQRRGGWKKKKTEVLRESDS